MILVVMVVSLTSCFKGYELEKIATDEWGILVPIDGDTTQQAKDNSYALYKDSLVSGKTIKIPYKRIDLGGGTTRKVLAYNLYKTKRTPVSLSWYSVVSADPQGNVIYTVAGDKAGFGTETKGSVGLMLGFNITFYVKSPEKYLFWKGTDPDLKEFGNTTIYTSLNTIVGEIIATYNDEDLASKKSEISTTIKKILNDLYTDIYGIEITELGMVGGIQFDNPAIQAQIDARMIEKMAKEAVYDRLDAFKAKEALVPYEETWLSIDTRKALIEYIKQAAQKGYTVFPLVTGGNVAIDISKYLQQ